MFLEFLYGQQKKNMGPFRQSAGGIWMVFFVAKVEKWWNMHKQKLYQI